MDLDGGGLPAGGQGGQLSSKTLQGLKRGDAAAWQKVLRLYGPLVYGWCLQKTRHAKDAEDVTQEVFLVACKKIETFQGRTTGDGFRAWLSHITANVCLRYWQHRNRQPQTAGSSNTQEGAGPTGLARKHSVIGRSPPEQRQSVLHRASELIRGEFEVRTWQAFWRVVAEGESAADVARDLKMTPNAVYVARCRILRRLREECGDLVE